MAKVTDVFVSGSVGNIIFYRRMGKNCARLKRVHLKQTVATKKRGVNFGVASRAGKALRRGLTASMPIPTDRNMQNRFSGSIVGSGTRMLEISYNDVRVPAQVLEFEIAAPAGSLIVTAARLIYKKWQNNSWVAINKEAFMPAGVIDARYK
ncbi:MAG: hypothetical protein ACTHM7_11675 [Ginsengibacter sp.]